MKTGIDRRKYKTQYHVKIPFPLQSLLRQSNPDDSPYDRTCHARSFAFESVNVFLCCTYSKVFYRSLVFNYFFFVFNWYFFSKSLQKRELSMQPHQSYQLYYN